MLASFAPYNYTRKKIFQYNLMEMFLSIYSQPAVSADGRVSFGLRASANIMLLSDGHVYIRDRHVKGYTSGLN